MSKEILFRDNKVFVREITEREVPQADQLLPRLFGVSAFLTPPLEPYTKTEWVLERRMMVNTKIPNTTTIGYRLAYLPLIDIPKADTGQDLRAAFLPMVYPVQKLVEFRKQDLLMNVRVYPLDKWEWWFLVNYTRDQKSASGSGFLLAHNTQSQRTCVAPIPNVNAEKGTFCSIMKYLPEQQNNIWEKEKALVDQLFNSRTNDHWNRWPANVTLKKHEEHSYHVLDATGEKRMLKALSEFPETATEQSRTFFKLLYDAK